jgi:putative ABC transport system ATP-binding protein
MLQFKTVSKLYTHRSTVRALDEVSLHIQKGEFTALVGPSGSGKTTFLVTAGAMMKPTSGEILFDGQSLYDRSITELSLLRRRKIGFLFQTFNLIPYLNALENVMAPLLINGASSAQQHQRATELLTRVGLEDRLDHKPNELSVGQIQRVALARMLANDPDFILADEPTGNLDPETAENVLSFLRDLSVNEGKTIVMVTHSPAAASNASRILHCNDGKITE